MPTNEGYVFTSNRDESPLRYTKDLFHTQEGNYQMIYPKDPKASGTWLAIDNTGNLMCLLNGAFIKHAHRPPYKKSRGILLLELMSKSTPAGIRGYDYNGMEPFTLIIVLSEDLYEMRWDGQVLHFTPMANDRPHIWSSCTLYNDEAQSMRKAWFRELDMTSQDVSIDSMLNFHKRGGKQDDYNGFVMNRNNVVQTVSISSIERSPLKFDFRHECLVTNTVAERSLKIEK